MKTQTTIALDQGVSYPYTPEQAADQVIAALGGNAATDTALVVFERRPESNVSGNLLISCQITLLSGDRLLYDANGCATQLLAALAGDPTKDFCQTMLHMQDNNGAAGTPPGTTA